MMNPGECIRRLKLDTAHTDKRYAFFVGAGCSVSSGIPSAAKLVVDHWLPQLRNVRAPERLDLIEWAREVIPDFELHDAALSYGPIMKELFLYPHDRQSEMERRCKDKYPGFGYGILAQVMALPGGHFNVALTTNFDDLIAHAGLLYTDDAPLVIRHESLAGYIRATRNRPLVVKVHGDYQLSPRNTSEETAVVNRDLARQVEGLLQDRGIIFIGYGGNDVGVVKLLDSLPENALPWGVYWVAGEEPRGVIRSWLEARNATYVQCADFDAFMVLFMDAFDLPHPDQKLAKKINVAYTTTFNRAQNYVANLLPGTASAETLREAIHRASKNFPEDWLEVPPEPQTKSKPAVSQPEALNSRSARQTAPHDVAQGSKPGREPAMARPAPVVPHRPALAIPDGMVSITEGGFKKGLTGRQIESLLLQFKEDSLAIEADSAREALSREREEVIVLPAFFMDRTLVTNAQFRAFVEETKYTTQAEREGDRENWRMHDVPSKAEHPVVYLTYHDALAYCQWVGKRLPTSDEWKKACRGRDGRIYPWGDRFDAKKCNTAESQRGWETTPVTKFETWGSPYGCLDMVGNVEEWTTTEKDGSFVVLGGSWCMTCEVYGISVLHRVASPGFYSNELGFRCVR